MDFLPLKKLLPRYRLGHNKSFNKPRYYNEIYYSCHTFHNSYRIVFGNWDKQKRETHSFLYFGPLVIYVTNGTLNFSTFSSRIQTLKMHIYVPILANCATHGPNQPNDLNFDPVYY